jgi:hypothetical protein
MSGDRTSSKEPSVAEFVSALQNLANMAALWVREPDSTMFKSNGTGQNGYRALFEMYDIRAAPP